MQRGEGEMIGCRSHSAKGREVHYVTARNKTRLSGTFFPQQGHGRHEVGQCAKIAADDVNSCRALLVTKKNIRRTTLRRSKQHTHVHNHTHAHGTGTVEARYGPVTDEPVLFVTGRGDTCCCGPEAVSISTHRCASHCVSV